MDKRLIIGLICLFGVCLLSAQDRKSEPDKKKKRVDLLYADEAQADKQLRPDVQVLIGSVRMKHDSMYMFCDSALIYEKNQFRRSVRQCPHGAGRHLIYIRRLPVL